MSQNLPMRYRILTEIIETELTTFREISNTLTNFNVCLTNNLDSFSSDQEIYLRFLYKKIDQFYELMKDYESKLNPEIGMDNFKETFEIVNGHLFKCLDSEAYIESFIVNAATIECDVWKGIYNKIPGSNSSQIMINYHFLSRLARYSLLHSELYKHMADEEMKEKEGLLVEKLKERNQFFSKHCTFIRAVKKDSKFIQSTGLFIFDYFLINLEFKIIETDSQVIENGAITISKLGELLLFKRTNNQTTKLFPSLLDRDSDVDQDDLEYELAKVVDIKNTNMVRLMYEDDVIRINSKQFQIIIQFNKKENQVATWNSLTKKREAPPTYFQFRKSTSYHDIVFYFTK